MYRKSTIPALKWFALLLALSPVSALFARDKTALPELDPALQAELQNIKPDPLPEELVNGIHYVVSDEKAHHLFRPDLNDRGGVFVGIGTNQNYSMAPFARPELLVLFDFDQVVINTHQMIIEIVSNGSGENPKAF